MARCLRNRCDPRHELKGFGEINKLNVCYKTRSLINEHDGDVT